MFACGIAGIGTMMEDTGIEAMMSGTTAGRGWWQAQEVARDSPVAAVGTEVCRFDLYLQLQGWLSVAVHQHLDCTTVKHLCFDLHLAWDEVYPAWKNHSCRMLEASVMVSATQELGSRMPYHHDQRTRFCA